MTKSSRSPSASASISVVLAFAMVAQANLVVDANLGALPIGPTNVTGDTAPGRQKAAVALSGIAAIMMGHLRGGGPASGGREFPETLLPRTATPVGGRDSRRIRCRMIAFNDIQRIKMTSNGESYGGLTPAARRGNNLLNTKDAFV